MAIMYTLLNVILKNVNTGNNSNNDNQNSELLSLDEGTLSAVLNGEHIPLKAKEFALLKCLYLHKNTIVKKEVLFDEVWGDGYYSDGTLNVHIRRIREKIEKDPNDPQYIKTIWGTGYIMEMP